MIQSGAGAVGIADPSCSIDALHSGPASSRPDPDPEHPFKSLFCSHCGYVHRIEMSCGSRVCPKCRAKWFGYHFHALYQLTKSWAEPRSLTLTVRNVPDSEFGRHTIKWLRECYAELRRRIDPPQTAREKRLGIRRPARIRGGFYVVQATNYGDGSGWHPHIHVMYDGEFIPKEIIKAIWREVTKGSYIIKINRVKTPYRAIAYLLADFTNEFRIDMKYATIYDAVFKGARLVQPFGNLARAKLRVPFKCPICGCTDWITVEDLEGEGPRLRPWYDDG